MTTHYHLLLTAEQENLSKAMQRLNGKYARWFNGRHGRWGHLFGERFASWVVDDEDHFDNTVEYILQNPVRAGLCRRAEDWPWSAVDERTFAR
jgi:putative transposase